MKIRLTHLYILVSSLYILSCSNEDPKIATLATVIPTEVSFDSAVSGGEVSDNGGAEITQKGVCWSTEEMPTIADEKTTDGSNSESFLSEIIDLEEGTRYYVRSYATNSVGTSYGNQVELETLIEPVCRVKEIVIQGHPNDYIRFSYDYDDRNRVTGLLKTHVNGGTTFERYTYNEERVEIYAPGQNGERLWFDFDFEENRIVQFNQFRTNRTDRHRVSYQGTETITLVLDKPLGQNQSLIPFDSTVYKLNTDGNIIEYSRWRSIANDPFDLVEIEKVSLSYGNNINPIKGLLSNFEFEARHINFVKYFNQNNVIRVEGRIGFSDYDISYELDQNTSRISSMNEAPNGYSHTYTYENCDSN